MAEVLGTLGQPAARACEVIHSDIHDLPGLAALLRGHVPGNPAVVDLQGRTLSGPVRALEIRTPGLILKHGLLCLPPKVLVIVVADDVKLEDITITRTTQETALPAVCSQANGVRLELCRMPGVHVYPGCSATLRWCILSEAPGCGVLADGPGSHVEVNDCDSCSNAISGFEAVGKGAVMKFFGRCKATNNHEAGFGARDGGRMTCSDGCVAEWNDVGFYAAEPGSRLIAGHGCRADRNTHAGFQSRYCAGMAVGDRCEACNNASHGFDSRGAVTQLRLGKGCRAVRNGLTGVLAYEGGKVVTGQGCNTSSNQGAGFSSIGHTSFMRVGARSRSAHNAFNFRTVLGGVLEAGEECLSVFEREVGGIIVPGKLGPNAPGKQSVW